jgi:uncharacterized protein (DUF2147 family)
MNKNWLIGFLFCLMASVNTHAQTSKIVGKWLTPDKVILEFNSCGNAFCAKQISAEKDSDKKSNGKQIAKDLVISKENSNIFNGTVIDPSNEKTYKGIFTISEDGKTLNLKVKWGFINFNEKWTRI